MKSQTLGPDLAVLLNSLSAGFICFSASGVISYANRAAALLVDSYPDAMVGTTLADHGVNFLSEQGMVLSLDEHPVTIALQSGQAQLDRLLQLHVKDKKEAWIRCNIEPVRDEMDKTLTGVILSFVDITTVLLVRKEQRLTEEKYRHHFIMNEGATFLATLEGTYLGVSSGAEKLFGYTANELKTIGRSGILIEDTAFEKALAERGEKGKVVAELKGRRKDGTVFPLLWYATLFTTSAGEELVSVAMIDISEKRDLENSAKKLDYNLQLLLDNTNETFVLIDEQFKIITFNKTAAVVFEMLHNSKLETGKNIKHLFSDHYKKELDRALSEVMKGSIREMQRVFQITEGEHKIFQTAFRPLFKGNAIIGIIINSRDITSKYKIQQELIKSNERFRRAAMASYDILWEHDLVKQEISFTEPFAQTLGYSESKTLFIDDEFSNTFLHPDDKNLVLSKVKAFIASKEIRFTYPVHRFLKNDGSCIYAEAQVIATRDEQGKAYLLTGVTRDITERYLMERQLIESNERYDLVAKATSDVVWDWNIETNANWFSENLALQYGHEEANGNQTIWEEKIHPDDREAVMESMAKTIEEGKSHWQAEYRFLNSNGSYASVYDRGYTLYNKEQKPYRMIGAMQNITELKNLQKKMVEEQVHLQRKITEVTIHSQEAEREELGKELHDNINQILATCKLLLDVCLKNEDMREDFLPKTYGYLNKAIEEIRSLSKSLVPPSLGDVGLWEALEELIQTHAACSNTTLRLTGDYIHRSSLPNNLQLMIYRIVQEQLNNIGKYANAPDAEINVSIKNGVLYITISDNGIGFNSNEKKKGIGLRNMKSRAQLHGGEVKIISSPGQGCALYVSIPVRRVGDLVTQ